MYLINWADHLPHDAGVFVAFSSLSFPDERDEFQRDVAEIRLPEGRVIDVEWDDAHRKYIVTLYQDDFDNKLREIECDDPTDVVERVAELVERVCEHRDRNSIAFGSTSNHHDMVISS